MKYAVIDTKTTGVGKGKRGRIVQVAIAVYDGGRRVDSLKTYVNPQCRIPVEAYRIHGIGYRQVRNAPTMKQLKKKIHSKLRGVKTIVAQNASFDLRMMKQNGVSIERGRNVHDTLKMGHTVFGKRLKLELLQKKLKIRSGKTNFHDAMEDVRVTAACYRKLLKRRGT